MSFGCLIVDEDTVGLTMLNRYLAGRDRLAVQAAGSVREALDAMGRKKFHVLIVDFSLPAAGKNELMTMAKESEPFVQIIAALPEVDVFRASEYFTRGASDFVTKPYKNGDVDMAVRFAMDRWERWRQLLGIC